MYKKILLACAALMLCFALPSLATAQEPEDIYIVQDGNWVLKTGGGEAPGPNGASLTEGMWWIAVDPESDEAAQGLERGVLLYDAASGAYSFLPTSEEQTRVENVSFSPDKQRMVLACNANRFATALYVYTLPGLELEKSFWGYSDVWFTDNVRFAFTLVDTKIQRPEEAGMWATSAAIYDPTFEEGYVVVQEATPTENFTVGGVNTDKGAILINVFSVPTEEDWLDIDKQEASDITIEIPAAG